MNSTGKYERWCQLPDCDPTVSRELMDISGDSGAIADRFYRDLAFGTGGIRGVLGAGTNRMNVYTVRRATQGLCAYLKSKYESPSVGIAYDSRENSRFFAHEAAGVFAAGGVKVHIFRELKPTPMLSFAIRELGLSAGVVITASHNPREYNGYKVYGDDGCQITGGAAKEISGYIDEIDIFEGVEYMSFGEAAINRKIEYIDSSLDDKYYAAVLSCGIVSPAGVGLGVVYTPLNGTGNVPVRRVLRAAGVNNVVVVAEQENPDPAFTTCPCPNPEHEGALALAVDLGMETGADIVIATDPDCDRVGAAGKHGGGYVPLNGNEMATLLFNYICRARTGSGTMPQNPVAVKTIVTTNMTRGIAEHYGVELADVLTGFKYIGEYLEELSQSGESGRFVFGMEESCGYLSGSYVRDKDGVLASLLLCEAAAECKRRGITLIDELHALWGEFGCYLDAQQSRKYEGAAGAAEMEAVMEALRKSPPTGIAGAAVTAFTDYKTCITRTDEGEKGTSLPISNVLSMELEGGSSVIVRPSGTEPKLKLYYSVRGKDSSGAKARYLEIRKAIEEILAL